MAVINGTNGNDIVPPLLLGAVTAIGDDEINGLDGDDLIAGYTGNDVIEGGAGSDTIIGGVLDVVLNVGKITLSGNDTASYDTSGAGVSIDLSDTKLLNVNVLGIQLALAGAVEGTGGHAQGDVLVGITNLTGSNFQDNLIGNEDDNVLIGLGGNDSLNGNEGNDTLVGGDGNDTLNGYIGNDKMTGGKGNDTYLVNTIADTYTEVSGEGTDRVAAAIDWRLGDDDSIEVLTTTKLDGTTNIDLRGNTFVQRIVGNDGNNILHDGGLDPLTKTTGADTLVGRDGNDTYIIYNSNAVIIENAGEGTDRVATFVDYKLAANASIEFLNTTNSNGTQAVNLTGNKLAQSITGNNGDNILHDGGTGGAADTMTGRGGNDTYVVYNAGAVIIEAAGQGNDTVVAAVSFAVAAGAEIENIRTISSKAATAIDLTGNAVDQDIIGNAGANRLDGKGGTDTLHGSGGPDTFVFSTALGATNVDSIADFSVAADTIELASSIFSTIGAGALAAAAFVKNAAGVATDAADRIVYDTDSGALFYDSDGTGGNAAVQFATLVAGLNLTNADFNVV